MASGRYLTTSLLLLAAAACVVTQTVNYRLPTTVRPSHYRLHLNLTDDTFTESGTEFYGMVIILFSSSVTTQTIQLHASHELLRINLITIGNTDIEESAYSINDVTDILTITTPSNIVANVTYQLVIDFTGQLSTADMYGFYKSNYLNRDGGTTFLATTQFQPTHARKAFPCFDEPAFKATFDVYLTYPLGMNALSNTPGSLYTSDSVSETYEFKTTALMSTYLLAFIISDFTCTQGQSIGPVPYRVCSREETAADRDWAVDIGPQVLDRLNILTDFNYSVSKEKLDQVAIPDFAAGAMENWGLVTYRESMLLWHSHHSSNSNKQSIANVISHEFAHFWFGNLVTCNWWSETFLNEGFATYYQWHTTHEVLEDWQLDKQYVVSTLQPILVTDSLENALALQSPASSPTQISAKFGSLSYSKGGSIFRMTDHFMGSEKFIDGLRIYLDRYQYSTVVPENLWSSLHEAVDNSITELPVAYLEVAMENWVKNPGFPLLTVTLNGGEVTVTQERFLLSGSDTSSRWFVPITYTTSTDSNKFTNTRPDAWLTPTENLTITLPSSNIDWVIFNNQQAGYYRVTYDNALWDRIRDALRKESFDGIGDINRAQIVDDVFNLARARKSQYSRVFDIIEFIANDTSYFSWVPALNGFNFLLARVGLESELGLAISGHVLELMQKYSDIYSFRDHNEDDQIYTYSQTQALTTACRLGDASCIEHARVLFSAYKYNSAKPFKNLRNVIYCNALRHSNDSSDWDFLWSEYLNATLATEQASILTTLGCSRNVDTLRRYLQLSITENSGIRAQDRLSVFQAVYNGNPVGVDVAFQFLRENHERIVESYLSMNALPNLINGLAGVFTTQEQVDQLQEFIESGGLPEEYHPSATTAVETAQANLEWLEYFEEDLKDYYFEPDSAVSIGSNTILVMLLVLLCHVFVN